MLIVALRFEPAAGYDVSSICIVKEALALFVLVSGYVC